MNKLSIYLFLFIFMPKHIKQLKANVLFKSQPPGWWIDRCNHRQVQQTFFFSTWERTPGRTRHYKLSKCLSPQGNFKLPLQNTVFTLCIRLIKVCQPWYSKSKGQINLEVEISKHLKDLIKWINYLFICFCLFLCQSIKKQLKARTYRVSLKKKSAIVTTCRATSCKILNNFFFFFREPSCLFSQRGEKNPKQTNNQTKTLK